MENIVSTKKEGNVVILKLSGKLTYSRLPEVKEKIKEVFSFEEMGKTILDLNEIKILDSAGIGLIVSLYKSAVKEKGKLVIVCSKNAITDMLKTVGVNKIIKVFSDIDSAMGNL